jgi:hypothetical protein
MIIELSNGTSTPIPVRSADINGIGHKIVLTASSSTSKNIGLRLPMITAVAGNTSISVYAYFTLYNINLLLVL